jgi:putative inorganic carbon (HCO3(-)) transporter
MTNLRQWLRGTPLDVPNALLVLMLPVSLWASSDLGLSLPKVLGLLLGIAVHYSTLAYARDERRLRMTLVFYLALGTLVAALGLVGTRWLDKNPFLASITDHLPRLIRGLPGAGQGFHPNEVAGVLLWVVPVQWALLAWLWCEKQAATRRGIVMGLATLLTTSILFLTQSRAALLGLGVALLAWGAWRDRRVHVGVILLLLVALAVAVWRGPQWVNDFLLSGVAPEALGESHWDFRLEVWKTALRGIHDFPLTGMGIGTFRRVARVLYPVAVVPTFDLAHAHNAFLQAALDLGLLGLLAYLALWWQTARSAWRALRQSTGWLRALAIGFAGCLVSSLVYSCLDTIAVGARPGLLWWVMLALIVALERIVAAPVQQAGAERGPTLEQVENRHASV